MTISEKIEDDLRSLIIEGRPLPCGLTLSAVAEHYEVSLMPVRHAVNALVDQDFLLRGMNGRLSVNPDAPSDILFLPPREPETDHGPEEQLTDHIIDLSLRGSEEPLREEATAEQFSVGRTVLRSILNRLAGEGIIEHLPRRGWRVRPFSEADMMDYIAMREQLELFALELAAPSFSGEKLREHLAANLPAEDGTARMDNRLHRYWIELSANRYLIEFFDQRGVYYEALFKRAVLDEETVARRAEEHRRILQALLDDNLLLARNELSAHIRDQRKHVEELFVSFAENSG